MFINYELHTNIIVLAKLYEPVLVLPTWSNWSILIFLPICFSINFFHFTNISRTSSLCLMVYTQQRLDKSSIKETKYWWSPSDAVLIRPQTLMWIQSRRLSERWVAVPNFTFFFFSRTQDSPNFKLQVNAPSNSPCDATTCNESISTCLSVICHSLIMSSFKYFKAVKFLVTVVPFK